MKKNIASPSVVHVFVIGLFALLFGAAPQLTADGNPPERMSYQGYLVDANGNALGAPNPKNYDVIFRLFTEQTGGARVWAEQQTITVDKGYFSVLLAEGSDVSGEPRPPLSTLFTNAANASDRFIETTVKGIGPGGADSTIQPRIRLLASPYAFLARNAVDAGNARNVVNALGVPVVNVPAGGTNVAVAGNVTAAGTLAAASASVAGTVTANTFAGNGTIPIGGIIMWSGAIADIPAGWALCNGQTVNGRTTPDLRNRFVVGAGSGYAVGAVGGLDSVTLTVAQMPSHAHPAAGGQSSIASYGHSYYVSTDWYYDSWMNSSAYSYAGGSQAHENRPPYFALAYIMRVQ